MQQVVDTDRIQSVQTRYVRITPSMAQDMLETMDRNRSLRKSKVTKYADDMRNGTFGHSEDAICFDPEGHLINGQHRLNAVIQAKTPVWMYVKTNVPEDTVFDMGAPRSTGDSLYMRGMLDKEFSNGQTMALVNAYLRMRGGKYAHFTDDEKCNWINKHRGNIRSAYSVCNTSNGNVNGAGSCRKAGVGAAILAALEYGISVSVLYKFADIVRTGLYDNDGETAAVMLRNYLTTSRGGGVTMQNEQACVAEQAIRDFVAGRPRHKKYPTNIHVYIKPEQEDDNV